MLEMLHPKSGTTKPVPATDHEIQKLRIHGFILARRLVDTVNGHEVHISAEPTVNAGQEPRKALGLVRNDPGNEGQPAFMTPQAWSQLSAAQKKKLVVGNLRTGQSPTHPDVSQQASGTAQEAALQQQIAELKAKLAAAESKVAKPS